MPSKQVTDRQKSANSVVAAIETHASAAATAIAATLAHHLRAGESLPDVALLLRLIGRGLQSETQCLIAADDAHQAELADDDVPRRAREDSATALRQEIIDLREILTGIFSATVASQVIAGPAPRDPVVLVRFAQTVEDNLSKVIFPPARISGASLDKSAIADRLASLRTVLEENIQSVAHEVREAQATVAAKDRAIDAFDQVFSIAAGTTSHLLRIAAMPEHAARVRPSARHPGETAEISGDEPSAPAADT